MKLEDLDFELPSQLIATEPRRPSRVAYVEGASKAPVETTTAVLLGKIRSDDLFIVNDSKVVPARVFTSCGDEILFLKSPDRTTWEVLFPAREYRIGDSIAMPGDVEAELLQKGLPQVLRTTKPLHRAYFEEHGELALPPYIQEARGHRNNRAGDREWYQPAWAERPGSVAAPTASLHFTNNDLLTLKQKGVDVETVTLHVGAGTFLPIRSENPLAHQMHAEEIFISRRLSEKLRRRKGRSFVLGTTATRAVESLAQGLLDENENGFHGHSSLFVKPGHQFKNVDVLLTNFHQPRSTLLLLVSAFAGLERVKSVYQWAREQEFRFYSYGDLSVWTP